MALWLAFRERACGLGRGATCSFWQYLASRLFQAILVVFVVVTIVFFVARLVGNPESFPAALRRHRRRD